MAERAGWSAEQQEWYTEELETELHYAVVPEDEKSTVSVG
jgi:hypothetical protein